ncbi:MAG: Uma2 family endonuclease [Sphingomonadaceae bacterium]
MTDLGSLTFEPEIPARFTIAQFEQLAGTGIFSDSKIELVEGVIVRMSPPLPTHSLLQSRVFLLLHAIFAGRRSDLAAFVEVGVKFGNATLRAIDVVVATGVSPGGEYTTPAQVLLAVEIANSTLSYDLGDKKRDYANAGIPHYWVVDPDKRVIHVMASPNDGDYANRLKVRFGEPIAVPATDETITIDDPR